MDLHSYGSIVCWYLPPIDVGRFRLTCKQVYDEADVVSGRVLRHLKRTHFRGLFVSLPDNLGKGGVVSYTRYLHELYTKRVVFVTGGSTNGSSDLTSRIDALIFTEDNMVPREPVDKSKIEESSIGGGGGGGGGGCGVVASSSSSLLHTKSKKKIPAPMWEACGTMFHPRSFHCVAYRQGEIFTATGWIEPGVGTVERYDVLSHKRVLIEENLPKPIRCPSLCVHKDVLYVIGGHYVEERENTLDASSSPITHQVRSNKVFWLAESSTEAGGGYWSEHEATLKVARYRHASVAWRGTMLVAGGYTTTPSGADELLDSVEIFDTTQRKAKGGGPETKQNESFVWTLQKQRMCIARALFTLLVIDDHVFAVGGDMTPQPVSDPGVTPAPLPLAETQPLSIERRDNTTGKWEVVTRLNELRARCTAVAIEHFIIVLGGGSALSSSWNAFNTRTGTWASATLKIDERQMPRRIIDGAAVTSYRNLTWTYENDEKDEDLTPPLGDDAEEEIWVGGIENI